MLGLVLMTKHATAQTRGIISDLQYQKYLHTLKKGCLLVELSDRAGIRQKLVQHNESAKLRRFDFEMDQEMNEIFSAFQKHYNFGKVYFFLKSETHLLREKSFDKMQWFDSKRSKISAREIDTTDFLIGAFDRMERKDSISIYDAQGKFIGKEPKRSFHAFVFRDMNYSIIYKDYFLHVRTILRNRIKVIRALNSKLTRNYNIILSFKQPNNQETYEP
jgi:hypothetical protein